MGWMSRGTQDAVVRLSQADTLRAVVIAGIGIAALDAAVTYDAAKAKGVDGALRSFAQSPFGPWLLILVALGRSRSESRRSSKRSGAVPSTESLSEYGVQLARAGWVCPCAAGRTRAVAAAMAGRRLSWP